MPYVVLLSTVMWGLWLLLMRVPHRPPDVQAQEALAQEAT